MAVHIGVGFGTAALGDQCQDVVTTALEAGFRKFDTAEADWWYDQAAVGRALQNFFVHEPDEACFDMQIDAETQLCQNTKSFCQDLRISTKIPPWSLTSDWNIRTQAFDSRKELVGFCDADEKEAALTTGKFLLDVYYIHAPTCWKGWHPRCDDHPPLLDLRAAWQAMENVVGWDRNARRIGLSNVRTDELLDIISFVHERQEAKRNDKQKHPPRHPSELTVDDMAQPRIPDVVQAYADPIQPADELRQVCQEHGIEFVSYSTLGTQHQMKHGQNPVLNSPIIQRIAKKHNNRSTAEVVLSWALQRGMSVIPRSSKKEHIYELARLLQDDPTFLDDIDLAEIDAMKHTRTA